MTLSGFNQKTNDPIENMKGGRTKHNSLELRNSLVIKI